VTGLSNEVGEQMSEGIKCQNCGKEIPEDEVYATEGKTLCEDCYIDVVHRPIFCCQSQGDENFEQKTGDRSKSQKKK
jgi:RNA polymerase-binding transcription factor DksA